MESSLIAMDFSSRAACDRAMAHSQEGEHGAALAVLLPWLRVAAPPGQLSASGNKNLMFARQSLWNLSTDAVASRITDVRSR